MTDTISDELLPCPFCGDQMEDRGYGAVHAWNTRHPEPVVPAGWRDIMKTVAYADMTAFDFKRPDYRTGAAPTRRIKPLGTYRNR